MLQKTLYVFFILILAQSKFILASETKNVFITKVRFYGFTRTSEAWAKEYLELENLPRELNSQEIERLRLKLLTSQAFTRVETKLLQDPKSSKEAYILSFDCQEKWTLIPVFRGVLGGGTPLVVLGGYDIHTFGKLWTFGAEFRRYGSEKPGWVTYAKAPRWKKGKHLLGFELWKDQRLRDLYNEDFKKEKTVLISGHRLRGQFLLPFKSPIAEDTQAGLDLWLRRLKASSKDDFTLDLEESEQKNNWEIDLLPTLVVDQITVDNILYDGPRFVLKGGYLVTEDSWLPSYELEGFYYHLWARDFNFASHVLLGKKPSNKVSSRYFLGGFDTVRGLPDGVMSGPTAAYANFELRHLSWRSQLVWLQTAAFVDCGSAAQSFSKLQLEAAAGFGIRISIPYVHRLMLRIDYAWGLGSHKTHGISAALNQFFQAYSPL